MAEAFRAEDAIAQFALHLCGAEQKTAASLSCTSSVKEKSIMETGGTAKVGSVSGVRAPQPAAAAASPPPPPPPPPPLASPPLAAPPSVRQTWRLQVLQETPDIMKPIS